MSSDRRGMTLLEALLATVILGGTLAGALVGVRECVRRQHESDVESRVLQIARNTLNELRLENGPRAPREHTEGRFGWTTRVEISEPGVLRASVVVRWTTEGVPQRMERSILFLATSPESEPTP